MWSLFSKKAKDKKPVSLAVTLWPAFEHFLKFANHSEIQGIRLNSAMMSLAEIDGKLKVIGTIINVNVQQKFLSSDIDWDRQNYAIVNRNGPKR